MSRPHRDEMAQGGPVHRGGASAMSAYWRTSSKAMRIRLHDLELLVKTKTATLIG